MSTSSKKIYTKYGDEGQTSLLYGGRVSKSNQHCEAYGATDEGSSALGLARALCQDSRVKAILKDVERELVTISAELATEPSKYDLFKEHFKPATPEMTSRLEGIIDELTRVSPLPRSFILPGGSPGSAAIDLARTVVRRAEREVVRLKEAGSLTNDEVLRYLNRLGDLLFVLARYEDRHLPLEKASDG
jgi:cob(I)alamin adenosyltransferase